MEMDDFDRLEELVIEHSDYVVKYLLREKPELLRRLAEWEAEEKKTFLGKLDEYINKQP